MTEERKKKIDLKIDRLRVWRCLKRNKKNKKNVELEDLKDIEEATLFERSLGRIEELNDWGKMKLMDKMELQ